ncbi:MAG: hypothetical protein OEZ21_00865 [Candidatus Bathyarchaeota archaeon]|nr:hypothetical protein [Candidatus Bathyarchaeota archaeon]MDH5745492.1 hypothetical protein [Candidatus Bathyarchaeota archaeon]
MSTLSKDTSQNKIRFLIDKYTKVAGRDYTEQDTITNFIMPFIEALGWDIFNVHEVKQQGYPVEFRKALPSENRPLDHPDCTISVNGNPHIVWEFKRLTSGGAIDRHERTITDLLSKGTGLNAKYAVLTSFAEAVVFDVSSQKRLFRIDSPVEYFLKFEDIWNHLSKEAALR